MNMESNYKIDRKYSYSDDKKVLKTVSTKVITRTQTKQEVIDEIKAHEQAIEQGKDKIKFNKNENERLKKDIQTVKELVATLKKKVSLMEGDKGEALNPNN